MKLGIFGDSYADINCPDMTRHDLDSKPWPEILEAIMGAKAEFHAQSSTPSWYSYQKFLKNYKKFDNIVFCYTDYNRWQSITDHELVGLSFIKVEEQITWLEQQNKNKTYIDAARKLVAVHPILDSKEFNIFIYQSIFNSINDICKSNDIKLVNLMPFETTNEIPIDISASTGACVIGIQVAAKEDSSLTVIGVDGRYCHLSPNNNKRLANTINELWDSNSIVEFK